MSLELLFQIIQTSRHKPLLVFLYGLQYEFWLDKWYQSFKSLLHWFFYLETQKFTFTFLNYIESILNESERLVMLVMF